MRSGLARLKDAENEANSLDSRFDLAYSAAHALCLAALRHHGFRASKRYIVFQVLPDTLGLGPEVWRVLAKCHDMSDYFGDKEAIPDPDEYRRMGLINPVYARRGGSATSRSRRRTPCRRPSAAPA